MLMINNLSKTFPDKSINYPNITAQRGEVLSIIGASGSGKSTLCEMIAGFLPIESGEILINKANTQKINVFEHIHYLSQFPEHNLIGPTWREDVELWKASNNPELSHSQHCECRETIQSGGRDCGGGDSELEEIPIWKLSFGQKKALSFCALKLVYRDIWVLDEPFAGLDIEMIKALHTLIRKHVNRGGIVIITSHDDVMNLELAGKRVELKV